MCKTGAGYKGLSLIHILLDVKNLGISFGGLRAVNGFDITIEKEQLYGLIGPNGAGKTTVFNLLTGVYKPDTGKVLLDGEDITGKKIIDINQAGIARTFQNIRLFKQMSVCLLYTSLFVEEELTELHLTEVDLKRNKAAVGDIYVGRVKKIQRNLDAAFIETAPHTECYYSMKQYKTPFFTKKIGKKPLCEGEELLVQVSREASGVKAPSVTTGFNLAGKYAVLTLSLIHIFRKNFGTFFSVFLLSGLAIALFCTFEGHVLSQLSLIHIYRSVGIRNREYSKG